MNRSLILTVINALLLLTYYISHDYIKHLRSAAFASSFLILPFFIGVIFYLKRKNLFWKSVFYTGLLTTILLSIFMFNSYKNSKVSDLYFDSDNIHQGQTIAEERTRNFIMENASNPKTYIPIKFGNLDEVQVYKTDERYDLDTIKQEIESGSRKMLDRLLDKKNKQKLGITQFALPHIYELIDKNGLKHICYSSISLDSNLNIISIDNNEDWVIKFWNEKIFTSESWDKEFKK